MVKNGTLASPATARAMQRLAGAGWADEENAARDAPAEALELLRIAQELDDLLQILLGLVDARDILERDAPVRLRQKLGLGLAEAHGPAGTALHLARQEYPRADKQRERKHVDEQRDEPGRVVGLRTGSDLNALLLQLRNQHRIVRRIGREGAPVGEGAADLRAGYHDIGDPPSIGLVQKLAIGDVASAGAMARVLEKRDKRKHQQEDDNPQGKVAEVRIHWIRSAPGGLKAQEA